MQLEIKEDTLKNGLLGLVIALVEVIRDALRSQALHRIDNNSLSDDECENLGREAFMELDAAIAQIKKEQGIEQSVASVRDNLDDIVNALLEPAVNDFQDKSEDQQKLADPSLFALTRKQ